MGMERAVTFAGGAVPGWERVQELLTRSGFPVQMRMIDGQLAFPDEEPPEAWTELRVAAASGMVTLRRGPDRVECVVWGNAGDELRRLWNALAWAFAEAGGGRVQTPQGPLEAAEFLRQADVPDGVRTS